MLPLNAITIGATPGSGQSGASQLPVGTFEGRVVQSANTLAVRVGSVQLPLPENAPLTAGQIVSVTKAAPDAAVQVRPIPIQQTVSVRNSSIADTLGRVLSELNIAANRNPATLVSLVPGSAPLTQLQVQQIINLFAMRGALGADLANLAAHVLSALTSGWNAPEWLRSFLQLAGARPEAEPDAIVEWLKHTHQSTTKSPEGSLAAKTPDDAFDGMLAQLRALRNDPALRAVLEAANRWTAFATHADAAVERLEARSLQQLHGLELNYVFAELPAPFPEEFSSVHLHWFRQGGAQDSPSDQVVLDLSVSQLGDLWIALHSGAGFCRCTLRAASGTAVDALRAESAAFESTLRQLGYSSVSVRVEQWNGDRLTAVARLMGGRAGLDVNI